MLNVMSYIVILIGFDKKKKKRFITDEDFFINETHN